MRSYKEKMHELMMKNFDIKKPYHNLFVAGMLFGIGNMSREDDLNEVFKELIDNCLASMAEDGISDTSIEYRKDLYQRALKVRDKYF